MLALAFTFAFEKAVLYKIIYTKPLRLASIIEEGSKGFVKTISIHLELLTSLSGQSDKSIKITIFIIKH